MTSMRGKPSEKRRLKEEEFLKEFGAACENPDAYCLVLDFYFYNADGVIDRYCKEFSTGIENNHSVTHASIHFDNRWHVCSVERLCRIFSNENSLQVLQMVNAEKDHLKGLEKIYRSGNMQQLLGLAVSQRFDIN